MPAARKKPWAGENARPNREARLAALRVRSARNYLDRKLRQVCCDCQAGLQDDDGVRCVECEERNRLTAARRNATPAGRADRRRRQKAYRLANEAKGLCSFCTRKAACGKLCKLCRRRMTEASKRYRERKAAGVIVLATAKRAIAARAADHVGYQPLDVRIERPRYRLLRALLFLDWTPSIDLLTLAGAPQIDRDPHRVRTAKALERLVDDGLVEARGPKGRRDYQLTPRGVDVARKATP